MATVKSEAVSVRVEPHIKRALQSAAEQEMRSISNMLEVMVVAYCRTHGLPLKGVPERVLSNIAQKGSERE
jgi:hypothetical protein